VSFKPRAPGYRLGRAIADSLSLSRLALAAFVPYEDARGAGLACLLLFLAMGASDILDGLVARSLRCQSKRGAALDAGVDFVVLLSLVVFYVHAGRYPFLLPVLMAASFGSFAVKARISKDIVKARFGSYAGAVIYLSLTLDAAARAFVPRIAMPLDAIASAFSALVLGLSVMENVLASIRTSRRAFLRNAKGPSPDGV
jgi:phosphatidylglycerophosphate synthase